MDYGSVIKQLEQYLESTKPEINKCFMQPSFYKNRALLVHRAFDNWCAVNYSIKDSSHILASIAANIKNYKVPTSTALDVLISTLPDEFNVRGQWTSEYATVSISNKEVI